MVWIHRYLSRRIRSSLLSGLIVSFATALLFGTLVAGLMNALDLPDPIFYFLVYSSHIIAIFAGTVHTTLRRRKRGLYHGLRISVFYALIVWLVRFLVSGTGFNWTSATLFLLALIIGAAAGMWTEQKWLKKQKKRP